MNPNLSLKQPFGHIEIILSALYLLCFPTLWAIPLFPLTLAQTGNPRVIAGSTAVDLQILFKLLVYCYHVSSSATVLIQDYDNFFWKFPTIPSSISVCLQILFHLLTFSTLPWARSFSETNMSMSSPCLTFCSHLCLICQILYIKHQALCVAPGAHFCSWTFFYFPA